ncbi:hypothetical protein BGZ51_004334 [Haplosporangium sp. Z 767]|nr:hypothetical protein BGZ51_004334 [Haplosporangium sp. Z 767]
MTDNHRSSTDQQHPTTDPFTDPNPNKGGARQTAAKVVALPLAAAGIPDLQLTSNRLHYRTQPNSKPRPHPNPDLPLTKLCKLVNSPKREKTFYPQ